MHLIATYPEESKPTPVLELEADETKDAKMSYNNRCRRLITFVVLLSGAICAHSADSIDEFDAYLKDPSAQRVAVQVCLPNRTALFDDIKVDVKDMPAGVPQSEVSRMFKEAKETRRYENPFRSASGKAEMMTIRRWRGPQRETDYPKPWIDISKIAITKTVLSAGGATTRLVDSTESNQAVFAAFTNDRLSDLVAIYVRLPIQDSDATRRVTYWYKPPKAVSAKSYSEWIAPISEERAEQLGSKPSAWTYLTQGREMPIYPVGENAPKIRYISTTNGENSNLDNDLRRARYTLQLQSLTTGVDINDDRHYFVSAKRGKIPPCGK